MTMTSLAGITAAAWRRVTSWRRALGRLPAGWLAALLLLAATSAGASPAVALRGEPVVAIRDGLLRGVSAEGADEFLGIPYAAPPVGPLRWQAPRPYPPWAGIRSAAAYGSQCPQLASQDGKGGDNENCLFLNVFTPPGYSQATAGRLPVLFWIHGGMLLHGASDLYDGSLIARTQHVIVVTVNYRLGAFGFLDVPGLGTSPLTANGNYGLLDQEAALGWVHGNIAAFGGDPGRVTIAGESAGGWSVCALLTSPLVRGLFSGAIMESASCASRTGAQAQTIGQQLAVGVGCTSPATAVACLRATTAARLLSVTVGAASALPAAHEVEFTAGGPDLPLPPAQAVADGDYARVPLLIGTNHDEARYFTQTFAAMGEQYYDTAIATTYGPLAPAILARYPWRSYPSPYTTAYALAAVFTDSGYFYGIGGCTEQNLAARFAATTPTFFYQFDDENAPAENDQLPGFQWGAEHTEELGYLWPTYDPYGADLYDRLSSPQLRLSGQMMAWWGAFSRLRVPATSGQPAWPDYRSGLLMSLRPGGQSQVITAATFGAQHQCQFWDAHPAALG